MSLISSFPRKRESILVWLFLLIDRSCGVPLAFPASGLLSCLSKKVAKEDTPAAAPSGHPALQVRSRTPGFATAHPCAGCERTRLLRVPAARPLLRPRAAANGAREEAHIPCAQKRERRTEVKSRCCSALLCSCLCAHGMCAALPGPPLAAARPRRKSPQGRRDGSRRFRSQHTDVLSAEPAADSRTRSTGSAEGAALGVHFFWLLFFVQALRRRSGANGGAGPEGAKGRMPVVKKSDPLGQRPSGSFASAMNPLGAGGVEALLPQ